MTMRAWMRTAAVSPSPRTPPASSTGRSWSRRCCRPRARSEETYAKTVVGALIALVTYWLALTYAGFTGGGSSRRQRASLAAPGRRGRARADGALRRAVPLASLVIFWIAERRSRPASSGSVYVADAAIIVAEIIIGVRAGLRGLALIGQVAIGAVLGVLVLALRLLLH